MTLQKWNTKAQVNQHAKVSQKSEILTMFNEVLSVYDLFPYFFIWHSELTNCYPQPRICLVSSGIMFEYVGSIEFSNLDHCFDVGSTLVDHAQKNDLIKKFLDTQIFALFFLFFIFYLFEFEPLCTFLLTVHLQEDWRSRTLSHNDNLRPWIVHSGGYVIKVLIAKSRAHEYVLKKGQYISWA